jgi:hypothetical protein
MRQPANFGMEDQVFILTAHVIAEQFKKCEFKGHASTKLTTCTALSNTDFNDFGILCC